jgi:hypothetical protein
MVSQILERRVVEEPLVLIPEALPEAPKAGPPPPALERLHALVRKGYRPEIGTGTATETIVLRHVGRAPDLVLHADGMVEGHGGRIPRFKKDVEPPPAFATSLAEQLRFMKFLDSVPKATLWDRTRRFRHKYVYLPVAFAILVAINLAVTALIMDGDSPQPQPQAEASAPAADEAAVARETAAAAAAAQADAEKAAPAKRR